MTWYCYLLIGDKLNRRKLVLIAFVFLLPLSACSSQKLFVEQIDAGALTADKRSIQYESFWEAMQNAEFDYLRTNPVDDERKKFAEGLKLVMAGEIFSAEAIFRTLSQSSGDSLLRRHTQEILCDLLFFQSKWEDLQETASSLDSAEAHNLKLLAAAFGKHKSESYAFPETPVTLPTKLNLTGNPLIEVEVNGRKKWFWIDTGAKLSAIASDVAQECGVRPIGAGKGKAKTATTKEIEFQPAVINELRLGELLIQNHPVIILKEQDLKFKLFGLVTFIKIDGVIGWHAIQNMELVIDYKQKQTTIRKPRRRPSAARNLFWLGYPIVRVQSEDGVTLNFGFDTGSNRSSVSENLLKKIDVGAMKRTTAKVGGAGGFEKYESQAVRNLRLIVNDYRLHFSEIKTAQRRHSTFIKQDGLLGSNISKNGRITFDYLNGRFEFELRDRE